MQDLMASFHGAKIFSKLDLLKSYSQVPVAPEDIPKTTVITPFGSYVFAFTFSLRNAGATFQRLVDSILGDLNFCVCYIDDILIFSRSHKEHLRHIQKVLQCLQENGLVVRFDKCTFGVEELTSLAMRYPREVSAHLHRRLRMSSDSPLLPPSRVYKNSSR